MLGSEVGAMGLYVPSGARVGKQRDGLYVGAAVVVHAEGGRRIGLVTRVYADDKRMTDVDGVEKEWPGVRPVIDALWVEEVEGGAWGVFEARTLAWRGDVRRQAALNGLPVGAVADLPCYQVVAEVRGS